jgi:hypothetical protein
MLHAPPDLGGSGFKPFPRSYKRVNVKIGRLCYYSLMHGEHKITYVECALKPYSICLLR